MASCPSCNQQYKRLGQHWSKGSCGWPKINPELDSVLTGLLLGDAYINEMKPDQHRLVITSKSEKFLYHLCSEWPWLFSDPYIYRSGENDYYRSHTVAHPHFTDMREWYSSGEKKFPDDLELDPVSTKYWYAGDGRLSTQNTNPFARIATANEADRSEWLIELLPVDATFSGNYINIRTDETQEFLDWMGDPVPGYEYKWDETLNYAESQ